MMFFLRAILACLLIAGWSFRLAVFGLVYSSDILTLRGRRTRVEGPLRAFASELSGVPARTLGTVSSSAEGVVFNYRPWLVLPRRTIGLGREGLVLVKGLLGPVLQQAGDQDRVLLRLPPRFARHSEAVGSALGGILVIEHPVVRGFRAAWGWLRAQLRRRPRAAQVTLSS